MSRMLVPQAAAKSIICDRLAQGDSLADICGTHGMPGYATVRAWRVEDATFDRAVLDAFDARANVEAERIVQIADHAGEVTEVTYDADGRAHASTRIDRNKLRQDAVRIATRQWLLERWSRRTYGTRTTTEVTGEGGGAVRLLIGPTAEAYTRAARRIEES